MEGRKLHKYLDKKRKGIPNRSHWGEGVSPWLGQRMPKKPGVGRDERLAGGKIMVVSGQSMQGFASYGVYGGKALASFR